MSWTFNPFTGKFDYHVDLTSHAADTDAHHAQSHNVASHSDTTATGAELETLTDNSIADALHRHSELVASDGSPDPAVAVDEIGRIGFGRGPAGLGAKVDIYLALGDNFNGLRFVNDNTTDNPKTVRIENATGGDGLFIDQNGNGIACKIDNDGTGNSIEVQGDLIV